MRRVPLASMAVAALVATTLAINPAAADGPTEPYVVLMDAAPVITLDQPAGATLEGAATAARSAPARRPDPVARASRRLAAELEAEQAAALEAVAPEATVTQSYTYALNGFAAPLTAEEAATMATRKGVRRVMKDELRQATTDTSGDFLRLTVPGGAYDSGITGEGVAIGVIDTGIWPEHASFADDGSYERPEGLADDIPCEFGDTDYNPEDLEFECTNKLVGARDMRTTYKSQIGPETFNSARDYDGHGTHTASTAAGNADVQAEIFGIDRGLVTGIAPRASVVAYSALGDEGGYGSDLAGAIDQAAADGVDVINYSIGGGPSLDGADDIAFLFAESAGVHVATSAGNDGPGEETVGGPASVPWLTSVGASTHNRTFENRIRLTSASGNARWIRLGTSLTEGVASSPLVDAEDLGNELCDPAESFNADITGKVVLCRRGVTARVAKSQAVAEAGGAGMILYNVDDTSALITDNHYVPSSHVNLTYGLAIKDFIDAEGDDARAELSPGFARWTQGSKMADFSSRGPLGNTTAPDVIKPDVTAPGVNILAGNTPVSSSGRGGQLFQAISGTSMSSPHVAGLFALMLQVHPDWSPSATKSALMTTARQNVVKEDGVTAADPFDMGAGHVYPRNPDRRRSMWQPGIVYEAGFNDYLAFLCGATEGLVNPASCDGLVSVGYSTDASDLNLASIGIAELAASQTVSRTVTNVQDYPLTMSSTVDAPEGFAVEVTPSTLSLAPGESATYEATFTNVSATPGEWAFGQLTWQGQAHKAKTPLAVRGTQLAAPDEVFGTGGSGSTSFDVSFGYSGEYTASAHGLAPEVALEGTVGQDEDQTFQPSDVGDGATAFDLDLSDTAMFRMVLDQGDVTGPGAEAADLDVFLLDADDNVVAASTSGGTAEQIDLVLPDPGAYTLYIHGWQTGGEELGFTAHTWQVPLEPGTGNLVIEDAPTSATQGTTVTVAASWTDAAEGTSLGAVSHTGPDGLLDLTLVQVTNE